MDGSRLSPGVGHYRRGDPVSVTRKETREGRLQPLTLRPTDTTPAPQRTLGVRPPPTHVPGTRTRSTGPGSVHGCVCVQSLPLPHPPRRRDPGGGSPETRRTSRVDDGRCEKGITFTSRAPPPLSCPGREGRTVPTSVGSINRSTVVLPDRRAGGPEPRKVCDEGSHPRRGEREVGVVVLEPPSRPAEA